MRHGRPDLPRNPFLMDRMEFNRYLEAYDLAGLSAGETHRLSVLYQKYPDPDLVVCSDLRRARETAEIFSKGAPIIVDPVFREIPVRLPDTPSPFLNARWPGEFWWSYLRMNWFRNQAPEGQAQSVARAYEATIRLKAYHHDVQRLAVVSHAGFLLVTINLLIKQKEIQGRRLPHIGFGQPTRYVWR